MSAPAGYQKTKIFRGICCLCLENVMHVLDPFFSDQVMVLEDFTYKVLVVIPDQRDFELNVALKC